MTDNGRSSRRWVKTAVASISCDGFEERDFSATFAMLPEIGTRYVELNCWYAQNVTPVGINSITHRCESKSLTPVSIHVTPFSGLGPFQLVGETSRLLWALLICERLGARILKFTGPKRGSKNGREALVEVLQYLIPVSEDKGITIVLENHFQNELEFAADYDYVFSRVDSPNLGVCFDIGHFVASGVDMIKLVRGFHNKIFHVDVKDCASVGKPDFVPYGSGIADIEGVLRECASYGVSGYQVVESPAGDYESARANVAAGIALLQKFEV